MKKILKTILYSIFYILYSTLPAFAQETLPNPLGTTDIPVLIGNVIKALLGITGSIALLMFIYGGLLWLTAAGNEKRIDKGRGVLVWATIGLGIIFTSYILVNFVIKALGVSSGGDEGAGSGGAVNGCCLIPGTGCLPVTAQSGIADCYDSDGTYEDNPCSGISACD